MIHNVYTDNSPWTPLTLTSPRSTLIARVELRTALEAVLERLPNLRIDGPVVRTGLVGNGHHHGSLVATAVLLLESRTVSDLAKLAEGEGDPRGLGSTLVHSVGGLVVLLLVTAMPVAKPRGITRYGWRKQQEHRRGGVPAGVR